jgi:NAD(P)-dependent dehydrogenase (short-subunit alcohol dehydrogenase family)
MGLQLEQGVRHLGSDPVKLDRKVALVTGTSRNIGGALAAGLAAEGARVACNDIDPSTAAACAQRIGDAAVAVPFDVTDAEAAAAGVATVLEKWGRIDILVNNACRFDSGGVLDMPIERFRAQVEVIVGGAFIVTQLVARSMVEAGVRGSIVNILSTAAWQGQAGNVGYCTAKSALVNFTRSVAMELARHGIRVNGLTPTATIPDDPDLAVRTSALFDRMAETGTVDFGRLNPWPRLPTPADYVGPLVFLASDDAGMVTGTNLTVDGGALAKYWPQLPKRAEGSSQ